MHFFLNGQPYPVYCAIIITGIFVFHRFILPKGRSLGDCFLAVFTAYSTKASSFFMALLGYSPQEQVALFCTEDDYAPVEREVMARTVHLKEKR